MGFRGNAFAFDSPAAAAGAMAARLRVGAPGGRAERCPLEHARGRILAQRVVADRDSPAFDYAAMDGYAVRADGVTARAVGEVTRLRVVGEARIGCGPPPLNDPSAAIRIVTGAAIPPGADAVVRREDVVEHAGSGTGEVTAISLSPAARERVRAGIHIRRRGENALEGSELLSAGEVLSSASLGTLAAVGCVAPLVRPVVRVAVVTTGDELVDPGAKPGAWEIRNSNAAVISSVLGSFTWLGVSRVSHVRDEEDAVDRELRQALVDAHAVVLTGGVSMGHRDPVREALQRAGVQLLFHGLPQRPGKPMLGGVWSDGATVKPVFGLPGNPLSAMVTCLRVVLPVLGAHAGMTVGTCVPRVEVASWDGQELELWWHRLVRLDAGGRADLVDLRGSGDVVAAGRSDGFVEVPPGFRPGSEPVRLPYYAWPR